MLESVMYNRVRAWYRRHRGIVSVTGVLPLPFNKTSLTAALSVVPVFQARTTHIFCRVQSATEKRPLADAVTARLPQSRLTFAPFAGTVLA